MDACIVARLLSVDDGYVSIVGWDADEWGIPNSTDRVRRHRERQREARDDETERNVSDQPRNAETPSRTSRSELADQKILSSDKPTTVPARVNGSAKGSPGEVRRVTTTVLEAFNRAFGRNLSPDGWEESVRKLLAKGFTDPELRAVVWWAAREWADDPEMRAKVTPKTLLKLTSSQGYRTFREYLSCAGERWREEHGGEDPPWERKGVQPMLGVVA